MARIEVPMPQMGESIAEGTVSRWLKQVGEGVQRDEPILEISTDKVDAEIPSPSDGTLVEIAVAEGETVEVGTIVAYIDPEGVEAAVTPPAEGEPPATADAAPEDSPPPDEPAPAPEPSADRPGGVETAEDRLRTRSTPVVRKIAEEHGVDLSAVAGTGHAGRVTKQDILAHIEAEPAAPEASSAVVPPPLAATPPVPSPTPPQEAPSDLWQAVYGQVRHPDLPVRQADRVEALDKIRRLTAEHMVLAKRVAPHVHSFIEIDFSRVDEVRKANKARWAEQGVKVSFTAFVVWACSRLLREFPMINGTISGNNLIFRGNVNVGVAVDLDPGLIVPVIHDADELSLVGIGKKIVDLADRARSRRLNPEEIQGATFSLTNPGVLGTLAGTPIIPKGTAGIPVSYTHLRAHET